MPELKEISPRDRFYYEVLDLRKRLDTLIREFESSMRDNSVTASGPMAITDPETGRKVEVKG
jgi:hypothetical protein